MTAYKGHDPNFPLIPAMSLPNPDVDLEQGQVSDRRSDAVISSMFTIFSPAD